MIDSEITANYCLSKN